MTPKLADDTPLRLDTGSADGPCVTVATDGLAEPIVLEIDIRRDPDHLVIAPLKAAYMIGRRVELGTVDGAFNVEDLTIEGPTANAVLLRPAT